MKHAEWIIWAIAALLFVAVVLTAWLGVPELAPASVIYSSIPDNPSRLPTDTAAVPVGATTVAPATNTTLSTTSATSGTGLMVRLNSATAEELMQIPGIGPKTAAAIIAYREAHNGFDSLEELLEIDGIGQKSLEKWRPYLMLD